MQAQGVDPSMAQPAVDQANLAALGGATNYNQLLNVLSGAEASGQASRLSEEQMARALAGSQLQSIYGSGRANVESEQLSALNALATQISNARITAAQQQAAQETAIQNALAGIYGTGYTAPPVVPVTGTETETVTETVAPTAPVQSAPVARLAQQVANAKNQTLVNRANAFIEANPTATPAQVAKAFPSLTAAAKKKK
jgi:outer membrane translocation and assembly module TamA